MNYNELAEEYFAEAKYLNMYIKKLKTEYYSTNNTEDRDISYRIRTLYNMYLELKHVGEYITYKYGGKNHD